MSEIKLNKIQHTILNLFIKKNMLVDDLKAALKESTGSGKIIHAQLGMLKNLALVEVEGEKSDKKATITKEGKEAAKQPEPTVAEKPTPKPKPVYTPLYTPEDIAGMKKKKAKKAQKKEDSNRAKWDEENKTTRTRKARTPSEYNGNVPVGKHQKDDEEPYERHACMDLWEEEVTPDLLLTRQEFIKIATVDYKMRKSTPSQVWSVMYKMYDMDATDVREKLATRKNGVVPETNNDDPVPPKKDKKKKKGKKSKK